MDSKKSPQVVGKGDWDDDDSMTLPSTTLSAKPTDATTLPPSESDDQITEEQQRPRFISLIPAGTHSVSTHSKSDQEDHDQIKYRVQSNLAIPTTTVNSESEQDDTSGSTTQSSSSSDEEETSQDSASAEQGTTERSRIKHIQLGKIPLTYEIIPLLPPREEKQQLLGREDTNPIGFFPPEEMMAERAKMLKNEQRQQEQQQSETEPSTEEIVTTEVITGKPNPDLRELPPVPLTYMVPPQGRIGEESLWHQYSQPTTTNNLMYIELPQTTTTNPLLERINDLLQKAKRHSLETETTTINNNESFTSASTTDKSDEDGSNTEKVEGTTTAERMNDSSEDDNDNQGNVSTTDPLTPPSDIPEDSNGDLNPSSPATIPEEPTEEVFTTSRGPTILFPRQNIPEPPNDISDYRPFTPYTFATPSSSPLPPISLQPSSTDQYFSDYNFDAGQQSPFNQYYYSNSNPASILRRRLMISSLLRALRNKQITSSTTSTTTLPPPPAPPVYISPESYWPNKYFDTNGASGFDGSRVGTNRYNANNNIYTPADNYNSNNYNINYNYNPYQNSPVGGGSNGGYNTDYDYYLRPQRQSPAYSFPTTSRSIHIPAALSNILTSTSEEPSYAASYGTVDGLNDFSSYGNSYYSGGRSGNSYYSYPSTTIKAPSPFPMSYRQVIPYNRPYPITSSDLVNELMYAPLYSYEQYRRIPVQQPAIPYY